MNDMTPVIAEAEKALARFRAEWPAERCKRLRDATIGTPAEKAAANASFVADALEKVEPDTRSLIEPLLTDEELKALGKGARQYRRDFK